MSMRRSRIKPAINLAASRRSTAAKSKPGATSSNSSSGGTNSNQKAKPPSKKAQEEKPPKKEPTKKQQPKEARRPDLDTKDDKEKTKVAELNSSKEGQSRAVDGALKEVTTDLAKDGVPEERDAVQSTSVGQKVDDNSLVNAEQESLPTEIFDTSTTDEGSNKNTNPVRRKRITAVPNFSQRRAPVTSSKSSLVAKSRPANTRKESEVSPGSLTVTDQKEKKKENNIAAAEVINDGPSDTKENKKTVEPPVVQRKILGKALSTAQKHGNPENKDQSTQRVIERDKLQSASARKDAPILDPITDKAVNGLFSATTEGPQEGMRHGNIYKKRLEEMNALKKEEAPFNRRKRFIQHPKDGIDTSKMKMKDLIYFNPKENKMRSQGANDMEKGSATAKQVNGMSTPRRDEGEGNMESSEETSVAAAPQVKIGPDGNVILDEQSLVKMVTPKRRLDESEITEVKEDSSSTTYSSFRKSKYSAAWSAGETNRFYNALSTVGTDFSMINAIFPNRKRRELKNKFKREERRNGALVEKALRETKTFDFSNFQNIEEDDNVEDSQRVSGETKTVTKPSKKRKKKKTEDPEDSYVAPRSRKADNNNQEDDNDDEPIEIVEDALPPPTDTELTSVIIPENVQSKMDALESLQNPFAAKVPFAKAEERKSSGEEDEFDMESILGKPTRSGRQPKQREVFTIQDTLSQPRVVRPSAEKDNAHHTKGKTGKRKKKMKHKKLKKCRPDRHTSVGTSGADLAASTSEISPETTASRVPPLHPELSECSPQGPFGMDSSLQLPSSMQDQHPTNNSPSFRTEHYLVTYPDGTKTLIQMPVSVENDKSFEFVLNVLPSPYREGTTLQLGVIPKNGNFSPHTPVQPLAGGMNIPVSTPGHGIPVTQVITPGSTMGNLAMGSLSQLRFGTSPLGSVPGPSASFSPGLAASSSRYDWSWSLPHSNPLRKTGMSALSPSNFVSHSKASAGVTTASGNKYSGSPSVLLTSGSRALPQSSALNKPSGQLLSGEITPSLSLTTSLYQTSTTDSIRMSGQQSAESVGQPSDGSASQFSKMSSSRQQLSPGNALPTFRPGFDRITSNFEEESSRPPIQILSSQSQPSQDRLFVSQNVIDAKEVPSSSFNLTDSNSHEISLRMQNNPSKGIHQPERFVEILSSNGQLVVGDNQVTDNSNIETEVVYVSGLVDPLPAGSEISDPIIAQHVDVSSSVQHDESQGTESEAFVPV